MAVTDRLRSSDFYQQIRHLLRLSAAERHQEQQPDKDALLQDALEMVSPLSLESSPDEVSDIEHCAGRWRLTVWRRGLTGALGALPNAYTQWLIDRYHTRGETAGKAFFDIFTHRLQVLRFLTWEKSHFYARAELRKDIPLSQASQAFSGMHIATGINSLAVWRYASLLSQPVRSMSALESWLSFVLSAQVRVEPFQGEWQPVEKTWLSPLGQMTHPLGNAPMLGIMHWEQQSRFCLAIGPVSQQQAQRFSPSHPALAMLHQCLLYFTGPGLKCDIRLMIDEPENPPLPLNLSYLGRDARLGAGEKQRQLYIPWEHLACPSSPK